MPQGTQPIGQSLYDFLDTGKQNGTSVYETSNMSANAQEVHQTIGYPPGQLTKLTVGGEAGAIDAITGAVAGGTSSAEDPVVVGGKITPPGKPDLVGSSTVVTAPPELTKPAGGLPEIASTAEGITDQIFKSYKGKA